ncbi:hypothetical protein VTJ04DRAFT_1702 [Mycothermus thermophilus]|uniref:uncharacterized protein n=1 Tax=Humicola insolens TaxID=85995 RepID=UPI00374438B7
MATSNFLYSYNTLNTFQEEKTESYTASINVPPRKLNNGEAVSVKETPSIIPSSRTVVRRRTETKNKAEQTLLKRAQEELKLAEENSKITEVSLRTLHLGRKEKSEKNNIRERKERKKMKLKPSCSVPKHNTKVS